LQVTSLMYYFRNTYNAGVKKVYMQELTGLDILRKRTKKTDAYSLKRAEAKRIERKAFKLELIAERGNKCELCGQVHNEQPGFGNYGHFSFDFHHLVPELKRFRISKMPKYITELELKIEVAKCICVCKQCHDQIHLNNLTIPEHFYKKSEEDIELLYDQLHFTWDFN
jgi:hypothetical protein